MLKAWRTPTVVRYEGWVYAFNAGTYERSFANEAPFRLVSGISPSFPGLRTELRRAINPKSS